MKKLLLFCLFPVCVSCGGIKGYQIEGTIPGAPEGLYVWLMNTDVYPQVVLDSAEVKDGRFLIRNENPVTYSYNASLVISNLPRKERPDAAKAYRFFMDNGKMTLNCIYDSLPNFYYESRSKVHNVTFAGSATQDLREEYENKIRKYAVERSALWQEYLEVYHRPALEGVFNTQQGKDIVKRRNELGDEIDRIAFDFIREHNASMVSVDIVQYMIRQPSKARFTAGRIDSIMNQFDPSLHGAPMFVKLQEYAANAKDLAYGEKYKDIELTDLNGNKVKLSDYVQPGKYNMLEFWASWCGPCRGEIPHLRHLYEQLGADKFNMISISIDMNTDDWHRAVAEEKMIWTQLCDPKGDNGVLAKVYHVNGIPDCLILDPEGRIVGGNLRGSYLDLVIENLTGETIR